MNSQGRRSVGGAECIIEIGADTSRRGPERGLPFRQHHRLNQSNVDLAILPPKQS
jgi:hypothetical protein